MIKVALKNRNWSKIGFICVLVYVSFINFFVIKATPDIIFLQFILLAAIYGFANSKKFFRQWIPFIGLFVMYEFLRGIFDDLSPFYTRTLPLIYNLEALLFHPIPTITLQQHLLNNGVILNTSLFFYSSFFYYSFLVSFILWIYKPTLFKSYYIRFLVMSYIGLIFYFLLPTAPPWMIEEMKHIGIQRVIYDHTILREFSGVTIYQYFVYGNAVAAFPSLHTAWTAFTSIYLITHFGKKYLISLIVPFMVGFSVVLTGEHFLLDVAAGWVLALGCVYLPAPNLSKLPSWFHFGKVSSNLQNLPKPLPALNRSYPEASEYHKAAGNN